MQRPVLWYLIWTVLVSSRHLSGQSVQVTMGLDTNRIAVGETTLLKVFAQIAPAFRTNSDRIFSWYVDLIHTNGQIAQGLYTNLAKPFSDNDPQTSSSGASSGSSLRGIYDTFLNQPGAGKDAAVLLFSVPVRGLAAGSTTFRMEKGSGQNLAHDFIVAPVGGGDPYTGGDYSQAAITLTVGGGAAIPRLNISHSLNGNTNRVSITFPTSAGVNYTVEFRDGFAPGTTWQSLPGAPHNSGAVTDTNTAPIRFYRVRSS